MNMSKQPHHRENQIDYQISKKVRVKGGGGHLKPISTTGGGLSAEVCSQLGK